VHCSYVLLRFSPAFPTVTSFGHISFRPGYYVHSLFRLRCSGGCVLFGVGHSENYKFWVVLLHPAPANFVSCIDFFYLLCILILTCSLHVLLFPVRWSLLLLHSRFTVLAWSATRFHLHFWCSFLLHHFTGCIRSSPASRFCVYRSGCCLLRSRSRCSRFRSWVFSTYVRLRCTILFSAANFLARPYIFSRRFVRCSLEISLRSSATLLRFATGIFCSHTRCLYTVSLYFVVPVLVIFTTVHLVRLDFTVFSWSHGLVECCVSLHVRSLWSHAFFFAFHGGAVFTFVHLPRYLLLSFSAHLYLEFHSLHMPACDLFSHNSVHYVLPCH